MWERKKVVEKSYNLEPEQNTERGVVYLDMAIIREIELKGRKSRLKTKGGEESNQIKKDMCILYFLNS